MDSNTWNEQLRGPKMSNTEGKTIFKYQMPILEKFSMKLPVGAEIVRIEDQEGMFWLWAVIDTHADLEERNFIAVKTGGRFPVGNYKYIGFCKIFVQMELGLYIFEEV